MLASALSAALILCLAASAAAQNTLNWNDYSSSSFYGPATVYGANQNLKGACSYGTNMANTYRLPWSTKAGVTPVYIAMNNAQFASSAACGACIWYRGTGQGVGVWSKRVTTDWHYGVVDNRCPECPWGALDQAIGYDVGDGRWEVEWHMVPCDVGSSKLAYNFVQYSYYYFDLVVSNGRVPVASVQANVNGQWVQLTKTVNNNYAYYNNVGPYTFPLQVRVTPVCGATVTDTINSISGGYGGAQFGSAGCSSLGDPRGGGGGVSSDSTGSANRAVSPVQKVVKKVKKVVKKVVHHSKLYLAQLWVKAQLLSHPHHSRRWFNRFGLKYPTGKIISLARYERAKEVYYGRRLQSEEVQ